MMLRGQKSALQTSLLTDLQFQCMRFFCCASCRHELKANIYHLGRCLLWHTVAFWCPRKKSLSSCRNSCFCLRWITRSLSFTSLSFVQFIPFRIYCWWLVILWHQHSTVMIGRIHHRREADINFWAELGAERPLYIQIFSQSGCHYYCDWRHRV